MITREKNCKERVLLPFQCILLFILILFNSCKVDDIGSYYTFTGTTIGQYLKEDPDQIGFTEFYAVLEETQVLGLLNAYGEYTCFAPSDAAMKEYYKSKGIESFRELREDEVLKIAYDHIIKDVILKDADFTEGILMNKSMSDRSISITSQNLATDGYYYVNRTSPITNPNLECHNGMIHAIGEALQPTERNLPEAIEADGRFKLFYEALKECKLDSLIIAELDESYDPEDYSSIELIKTANGEAVLPEKRKFGYTVFMQSDSLYKDKYGIEDLDGLKNLAASIYNQTFPEDAGIQDITNRKNSLNRFISYQMLDRKLNKRLLMDVYTDENRTKSLVPGRPMYEYIETMCENTLMEITHISKTKTNLLNYVNDGNFVSLLSYDGDAVNGVYHELDGILSYNKEFCSELFSKRLRIDMSAMFPEITNNGFRGGNTELLPQGKLINIAFPSGYLERMKYSEYTNVMYLGPNERFCDYQGDEMILLGTYEFEIITPPIPAGVYEVRFGYQPTNNRGVAQLYWDNKPVGIPLDMRIDAVNPKVGWVEPGSDSEDPYGYENDKMMRNRGYMKGGSSYRHTNTQWYSGANARLCVKALRRVLGTFNFAEPSKHKFRVKAVKEGECMLDFLEFAPSEILEKEDIY